MTIHLFKAAKSESEFEFTNLTVQLAGGKTYSTEHMLITEGKADSLEIDRNRASFVVDASVGSIHGTATLVLKQGATLRLDERFSKTEFTIRQKKTSATDLIQRPLPVRPSLPEPKIDYLAKDFGSFRKLILDRLSLTMPGWQERREADFGMTIVELLSYVGDQLSYYQDAVATEAYLDTARLRSSVRKHSRLIDYRMHEGCNSRAFVHIEVDRSTGIDMADVMFLTKIDQTEFRDQVSFAMDDLPDEVVADSVVFEPIAIPTSSALSPEQILNWNELRRKTSQLYDWWQLVSASTQEMASVTQDAILCFLNRVIRGSDLKSRKIMDPKDCIRRRVVRNRKMMDRIFGPAIQASRTRDRLSLFAEHNTIQIYDWGNPEYSIPKDSTSVCLVDELPSDKKTRCDEGDPKIQLLINLQVGDWLAFEEVKGPKTGLDADANPSKRQVVRVTGLERTEDPVNGKLLLKIHWDYLDRLTDSYCVSSTGQVPGCQSDQKCFGGARKHFPDGPWANFSL